MLALQAALIVTRGVTLATDGDVIHYIFTPCNWGFLLASAFAGGWHSLCQPRLRNS